MLKSRDAFPPGGFLYVQRETGWEAPKYQTFRVVVQALIQHRKANPGLAKKHNWALDYEAAANEVDAFNDARCRAHGWLDFVTGQEPVQVPFPMPHSPSRGPGVAAAKRAARSVSSVKAGIKTLLDWLGSGGRPVEKERAEKRAAICMTCPKNGTGGMEHYFTVPASQVIKLQLEIKNDLKLATSRDKMLNVCEACLCPLKLKVWCPMDHILKEMDQETKGKLDARCWILSEAG